MGKRCIWYLQKKEKLWIIKNICKIHLFYYIIAFICVFTGNFKGFFIFTIIIIIHEFGHIAAAIYYNWKIERIILLPFGALTIFNEKINKPLKEELIVVLMGPLFQIIGVIIIFYFFQNELVLNYNNLILAFNLLPIFPLDGSKILNIILNKITNFKRSHLFTIYISVLTIIAFVLKINFNLIMILIILFLLIKIKEEYKNHKTIFNKFLLERYINNFNFKKRKTIKGKDLTKMKKDCSHIFYEKKYYTEKELLKERFDFKSKM